MSALIYAGTGLTIAAFTTTTLRVTTFRQSCIAFIAAHGLLLADVVLDGDTALAMCNAAMIAYWLHRWWNSGDGPRRRLRGLARRFRPVRRTAPASA